MTSQGPPYREDPVEGWVEEENDCLRTCKREIRRNKEDKKRLWVTVQTKYG